MTGRKKRHDSPARIILYGFLVLIACGTILLMLPISTRDTGGAPFLDALFTATSATCVTGLIVHDTATYWSGFGQAVILCLIQVGGMGVVTMAVAVGIFSGRKIGLKQRWVMQESISAPHVGGIVRLTGFILKTSLALELAGAFLLALRFCPALGGGKGLWYGLFHSISAFCNAGFDLMGVYEPLSSLTHWMDDPLVMGVLSLLIIVGGLGFLTWDDVVTHKHHFRQYRLQSKVILCTTGALLLGSFAFFALYEFSLPQWSGLTLSQRLYGAAFQAVTPRTAGFNSVDLASMSQSGQLVVVLLMLVGGAPGSTAGGYKVTTLAVLFLSIRAVFRRRGNTECFDRRLPTEDVQNACALFVLYLVLFLLSGTVIACVEQLPLLTALFEAGSALGTAGLTLGVTGSLGAASRLILICLMYFGRVGGLTMLYAASSKHTQANSRYPQESITVG
jgi:trk system potassium uptake protein TrkH